MFADQWEDGVGQGEVEESGYEGGYEEDLVGLLACFGLANSSMCMFMYYLHNIRESTHRNEVWWFNNRLGWSLASSIDSGDAARSKGEAFCQARRLLKVIQVISRGMRSPVFR